MSNLNRIPVSVVVTIGKVEVCRGESELQGPPGYENSEDFILEGVVKAAMLGLIPKMPVKNLDGLRKRLAEAAEAYQKELKAKEEVKREP